jgi:aspartate/methionine/tyrosine aminotransferase
MDCVVVRPEIPAVMTVLYTVSELNRMAVQRAMASQFIPVVSAQDQSASTGLRLAHAVVPERAVERVGRVARSMNAGSPALLQAAVADFIGQGHFARHLKRMRALYSERRMLIVHG